MRFKDWAITKIQSYMLAAPKASNETEQNERNLTDKKRTSYRLKRIRQYYYEFGQKELEEAILFAENPITPRRQVLYTIYRQILRDLHLRSQIGTAINKVLSEPWVIVDKDKNVQQELTDLLQKKWFEDVGRYFLEAEFWGHSLIEFGVMVPNITDSKIFAPFEFEEVTLMEREHVRPETGELLINPWDNDGAGFSYRDPKFNKWFLEAGNKYDLGLLQFCSIYSIHKRYNLQDWARSNEKYGDPILVIRSGSTDDDENDKKEEFARNMGANGYAILDKEDEITLLERKGNGDGHKCFMDFNSTLNEENSKGVNGQTATADEKAFVGAAEVQERIMGDYTELRLRQLFYFHNDKTLPFLIGKGYKLEGMKWVPTRFLPEETTSNSNPDKPTPENDSPGQGTNNALSAGGRSKNNKYFRGLNVYPKS